MCCVNYVSDPYIIHVGSTVVKNCNCTLGIRLIIKPFCGPLIFNFEKQNKNKRAVDTKLVYYIKNNKLYYRRCRDFDT